MRLAVLALLLASCAAPVPDVPSAYYSQGGRVEVVTVDSLQEKADAYGLWLWDRRRIELDARLSGWGRWLVFFHEQCHQRLDDNGVKLDEEAAERVCDAMALAMVADMVNAVR